jgi:hypothetical protein
MLRCREERVIPEWLVAVELAVSASCSAALVVVQHSHFPCPANCKCATTRLLQSLYMDGMRHVRYTSQYYVAYSQLVRYA